jgi:hypothetical protein
MAQHLCIVGRDNPLLLGYLNIALRHLTAGGDELEIIIDRRPDPSTVNGSAPLPRVMALDQRSLHGVDALLRSRGYAIVSRELGESWHLSSVGERPVEVSDEEEHDDVVDAAALQYRSPPIPRRTLVAFVAVAAVVLAASVGIPGDGLNRFSGVAGHAASWLRSTPEVPGPAPRPAPATTGEPIRTAALVTPPVARPQPAVRAPVERVSAAAPLERTPVRVIAPPPTTAPRVDLTPRRPSARIESAAPAGDPGVAPAPEKPLELRGAPRVEMSRERDASGRTAAITVRVTDPGGRPLPAAEVRIRRHLTDGAVRETRLEATTPEGSYRGPLPAAAPNTDGLTMRITIGEVSHEVPLAE